MDTIVRLAGTPRADRDPEGPGASSPNSGAGTPTRAVSSPLASRYVAVRAFTQSLCETLAVEDYVVSSMPDVSPTKWHLAHTSWFFETFLLAPHLPGYTPLEPRYSFLFNSYYVQAGERHCRAQRGLITRPTVAEVYDYRAHVDEHMHALIDRIEHGDATLHPLVELGLNHEQQHQELLVTDIKHVFWTNPMRPAYLPSVSEPSPSTPESARMVAPARWHTVPEGLYWIGHTDPGFAFDNEGPPHRQFLEGFRIGSRLVTNGEYLEFVADGGYRRAELWLSAGFTVAQERQWQAPLYWERDGDAWTAFTAAGMRAIAADEPVCHVSYYEADAFARWATCRLPSEAEWEVAATSAPVDGMFADARRFHPAALDASRGAALGASPSGKPAVAGEPPSQLYGDVWQWTRSPYTPYPGFSPMAGAVGEYNGKFMCDQWVLRGASCATPRSHARLTYRNFFPSDARWQFSGIRLATDA